MPKASKSQVAVRRITYVLSNRKSPARSFRSLDARVVSSVAGVRSELKRASQGSLWISYDQKLTLELLRQLNSHEVLGGAVFVHELAVSVIPVIGNRFRRYAFAGDGSFLPEAELVEVLTAENRGELIIGCLVHPETETVTLWRGNLMSLTVPFSAFAKSGDGTKPDFRQAAVTDCGQTLQLGPYEAAVDAILYEYDAHYRRQVKALRAKSDRTFGASLKRLRKQLGLSREDFAPAVAAKTIARIERNEVTNVHAKTLKAISSRLGVSAEEIESY